MQIRARDRRDDRSTDRTIALVGAAALVAWLLLRGRGIGTGTGARVGADNASAAPPTPAPPRRCALRLTAAGLFLDDGTPISPTDAAALCTGGADLTVRGDARWGDRSAVIAAFNAAGHLLAVRDPSPVSPTPTRRTP